MRPLTIMNVHPSYRDQVFADAVPMAYTGDDLDVSAGSPIPRHYEAGAAWAVRHLRLRGGQFLAFHTRAADRAARARWRRLIQGSITIKLADHGEMTMALTAKSCRLAGAIARVAHKDEVTLRKPAHQAGQQQPGEVGWRLMPRAVHAIPFRRTVQGRQDGECPGPGGDPAT